MQQPSASTATHTIELALRSASELFESSPPLGQGDHVVRHDLEAFLMEQLEGVRRTAQVKLKLVLPPNEIKPAQDIVPALRAGFASRSAEEQRGLREIFRQGRTAAAIGFVFLVLVNAIGEGIRATFESRIPIGIANGLEIFGWVAMWRPAELLLYDWLPVRRKRNDLQRLANMEVEFSPSV
jgi:hypothetical protein